MKKWIVAGITVIFLLFVGLFLWLHLWLPSDSEITGCLVTKMYQVHLCPGSKNYVPLKSISSSMKETVLATEDSLFYQHKGFDWQSIERNAREGWESGVFKKGGSTISQQLAKNLFLTKDRTFSRKAREALITMKIERLLSKSEILERYLNVIEFGKGLYGIKAAAAYYFQKSPAHLTVMESAFLAMLLPNPQKYSSSFHKQKLSEFAHNRMQQIIDNLYRYKKITEEEHLVATEDLERFLRPLAFEDGFSNDAAADGSAAIESDATDDTNEMSPTNQEEPEEESFF